MEHPAFIVAPRSSRGQAVNKIEAHHVCITDEYECERPIKMSLICTELIKTAPRTSASNDDERQDKLSIIASGIWISKNGYTLN